MNTTSLIVAVASSAFFSNPLSQQVETINEVRSESVDRAIALDGINDFVTVPACEAMRYPGEGGWTFELWVKPVIYPHKNDVTIVGQESVGINARDPWSLRAHPTHFEFRVDDNDGARDSIRFDMALGIWQHVACVYENNEIQGQAERWIAVYVDGQLVERRVTPIEMGSRIDPVYMGALASTRFCGLIDDVRVWSDSFDQTMAKSAMDGRINLDNQLRGFWQFNESSGAVALDSSIHGAHAVFGRAHDPADHSDPKRVVRTTSR